MAERAEALKLAEAMASRLCHDLSGPIGSLNQALELAAGSVAPDNEAFALARRSAGNLARRIGLLRAAWGAGGSALDLKGLRTLAADERTELDVTGMPPDTMFAPPMARVLLNLLLLARESLGSGGRVALSGNARDLFIAIDGPHAAWPPGTALCLADETAAMAAIGDPVTLQMPLTALFAFGLGLRLTMLLAGNGSGPPPLRLSAP
jgi:histidine phosphotransferase ChpT